MYKIEVHKRIHQLISVYYFMRLWHEYHPTDFRKRIFDLSISLIYLYYVVSVFGASFTSDTSIEVIYLAVHSITGVVMIVRLYYLLCKKDEIIELIHKISVHLIEDRDEFDEVNNKIERFVKYSTIYYFVVGSSLTLLVLLPIFSNEKQFPVKQYLTLNWRENDLVYWITYIFVAYVIVLTFLAVLINMIIWYLMMSCVIKYKSLGKTFKNLGLDTKDNPKLKKIKASVAKKQDFFLVELITLIKSHRNQQEITDQMKSCFSTLFLVQIGTSGMNICCSVYNLAFNSTGNLVLYGCYINILLYQFFDIFMLAYYGNEIKFWSTRLSYSVFECNWMNQSELCKKYVVILMEVLKRPQVLVIGKLYPLDLEIFTNILNFAYGMFNMLNNLQK